MHHSEGLCVQRDSDVIASFLKISENMVSMQDEHDFMQSSLETIGQTLRASRVYIIECDDSHWYTPYDWVKANNHDAQAFSSGVSLDIMEQLEKSMPLFLKGKLKIVPRIDMLDAAEDRAFWTQRNIVSFVAMPLFAEGRFVGILGIDNCKHNDQWTEKSLELVETFGHLLISAKEHFKAQKILQDEGKIAQQMLDALPVPFYIVNPQNYELVLSNKVFSELVAKKPLPHQRCYEVLHGFTKPCSFCGLHKTKEKGVSNVWQHRNDILNADFTIIATRIDWGNLKNAYAVAFIDITDVLQMQKDQVLEREAVKVQERFLANMSHELRTPVNGIIGMASLAEKKTQDQQIKNYLKKIQFSAHTLLHVINNILDFSKIEAGKMELECSPFNLKAVCEQTVQKFSESAEQKGLSLHMDYDAMLPMNFMGDSLRIAQILQNFVNNALKFTDTGQISLRISADTKNVQGVCTVRIAVIDTGIGMTPEYVKRLFDIFFMADKSFSRQQGGSGVGLPLVHGLIKLMQGELHVTSAPGQGTTFECILPLTVVQQEARELKQEHGKKSHNKILKNTRILFAEDNEINVIIAREMLESFGCMVDVAMDGVEVLELLEKNKYDAVLMDMEMPRMTGFEATAKIRSDTTFDSLPIIGMSAHSKQDVVQREALKGMQAYVMKPFEPQELYDVLSAYTQE